jgi:hypothetical protein
MRSADGAWNLRKHSRSLKMPWCNSLLDRIPQALWLDGLGLRRMKVACQRRGPAQSGECVHVRYEAYHSWGPKGISSTFDDLVYWYAIGAPQFDILNYKAARGFDLRSGISSQVRLVEKCRPAARPSIMFNSPTLNQITDGDLEAAVCSQTTRHYKLGLRRQR